MLISNVSLSRAGQASLNPTAQSSPKAASTEVEFESEEEVGVDISQIRSTAISALKNPRFARALDQLMDPRSSEMLALMRDTEGSTGIDYESAKSRYVENNG
jgi:hypothetical protein